MELVSVETLPSCGIPYGQTRRVSTSLSSGIFCLLSNQYMLKMPFLGGYPSVEPRSRDGSSRSYQLGSTGQALQNKMRIGRYGGSLL